jgi:hypothetical protein
MMATRFNLHCSPEERAVYEERASARGVDTIAQWIRPILMAAAEYEKATGKSAAHYLHRIASKAEWHNKKNLAVLDVSAGVDQ